MVSPNSTADPGPLLGDEKKKPVARTDKSRSAAAATGDFDEKAFLKAVGVRKETVGSGDYLAP